MGAFIFRQPNGLLGRFSTIVDCPTHHNMTDSEYIELCAQQAREEAIRDLSNKSFIKPYKTCLYAFVPGNMSQDDFDKLRKEMETEDKAKTRKNQVDGFLEFLFEDYRNDKQLLFTERKFDSLFIEFVSHYKDPVDAGNLTSLLSDMKEAKIQVVALQVGTEGIGSLSLGTNSNLALPPLVFFIVEFAKQYDITCIDSVSYTSDNNSITITFS